MCAADQRLTFRYEGYEKTETGYRVKKRYYRCDTCRTCPIRAQCTKGLGNRQIGVSRELQRYKQMTRERLSSEEGRELSVRRMVEVKSVFGQLKA
ncbi:transposase, partial [Alicyclobacillus hesperidum]|uniref:transposase n=1 Tax=Alicyclobacillus hesperidum TaxID=89784 RepID=UPI0036F3C99D